jgi:hypothetical protein
MGGGKVGSQEKSNASTVTFEVESRTSFRASNAEYDWRYAARHCPQAQLPEPWRSNDISDLAAVISPMRWSSARAGRRLMPGPPRPMARSPCRPSVPALDWKRRSSFFKPLWWPDIAGLVHGAGTDWDEVPDLVTDSYRLLAPKKLAASVARPGR